MERFSRRKFDFMEPKLDKLVGKIGVLRYNNLMNIEDVEICENTDKHMSSKLPVLEGYKKVKMPFRWEGFDDYLVIKFSLDVEKDGMEKCFLVNFVVDNVGPSFEGIYHINGQIIHGIDQNTREIFIPKEYHGQTIEVAFHMWSSTSWHVPNNMKYCFESISYNEYHREINEIFYDYKILLEHAKFLGNDNYESVNIFNRLNDFFILFDQNTDINTKRAQLVANKEILKELLANNEDKKIAAQINMVGHSHIDLAWLWHVKNTKEKATRTFSKALHYMDQYEDYKFLQSQPQLYQWIKDLEPEIYEGIKTKVSEGKWEPEGAMWCEADCNIPSGESLVRQVFYGKKFFKEEFGRDSRILWLPDVFGYSSALPQILKKAGVDYFITTKISWNEHNKLPSDTFYWTGIDGSQVLTQFLTVPDIGAPMDNYFVTYNGLLSSDVIYNTHAKYIDKEINNTLPIAYGYGDGGGGVTRDMLEAIQRYKKLPNMPEIVTEPLIKTMDTIAKNVEQRSELVKQWKGDLYLESRRGTYTSQGFIKKLNRELENTLYKVEYFNTLCYINGHIEVLEDLEKIESLWKQLLLFQFHDILPGSSIKQVYDDVKVESVQINSDIESLLTYYYAKLFAGSGKTLVNTSSKKVKGNLFINDREQEKVFDKTLSYSNNIINPFEMVVYEEENNKKDVEFSNIITTSDYMIEFGTHGEIISLIDTKNKRQLVKVNDSFNNLVVYEDIPLAADAWCVDIFYKEKFIVVDNLVDISTQEDNNNYYVNTKKLYRSSTIEQTIVIPKVGRRIDFVTKVDWQEHQQLLKTEFNSNIFSDFATYDIQFGRTRRATHENTSWDMTKFEKVNHKFFDISEPNYGISIINDSKYGCNVLEGKMMLTLIKSGIHPDLYADIGNHEFTYSLFAHDTDLTSSSIEEEANIVNNSFEIVDGSKNYEFNIIDSISGNVNIDAIKVSDDKKGLIIRMHELNGNHEKVSLKLGFVYGDVYETNLLEEKICDSELDMSFAPFELKTLYISFKK